MEETLVGSTTGRGKSRNISWLDQVMNDQSKTAIGWRIVVLVSRKKKRKKHYLVTEEEAGLALEVLLI
jgi:hypothetical protein